MGTCETRALAELRERTKNKTQEQIADAIGCSQQMVSLYLTGQSKPGTSYAARISRVYRIPIAWWSEPVPAVPSHSETPARSAQAVRVSRGGRKRAQGVSRTGTAATAEVVS